MCAVELFSSGSGFAFNDYDNTNTNTNVSSHLCFYSTDLASRQKINYLKKGVGIDERKRPTKNTAMKRIGNLYEQIISIDNLMLADQRARKGKSMQYGVQLHDRNREANIYHLRMMLQDKTFTTSAYSTFTVFEPKERLVFRLPYYPDRIVHHAVMNVLERVFVATFTADTYSCIKGKGIHAAAIKLKKSLKDTQDTKYCLKFDIKKFYPSIDHDILKQLLRRKFKDNDLLWLLDNIIDSADGVPIGNYLSQYFANFYLTYFDHWLKETKKVKYYFRYADDVVILHSDKAYLHSLLAEIRDYLQHNLKLMIKENHQVFPVEARSIDFVGYRFYHTHTLLRKSIKKNFARAVARNASRETMASYMGWAKHCNSTNLLTKLMRDFKDLNIKPEIKGMSGDKIKIERVLNREIVVHSYKIVDSKYTGKCLHLQIAIGDNMNVLFTGSTTLIDTIQQVDSADLPFKTTIIKDNERFLFS